MRPASRGAVGYAWFSRTRGAAGRYGESIFLRVQQRVTWSGARGERGATAVEYGLIIVFIAGVIAAAVTTLGHTVSTAITNVIKGF